MAGEIFDAWSAVRSLRKNAKHSVLAVATLSTGLACVVLVAALLNGFLLRPIPFQSPDQLIPAGTFGDEWGSDYLDPMTPAQLREIRDQLGGLAEVAGFQRTNVVLSDTVTERNYAAYVTANLFPVLGVAPLLGRNFNTDDEKPGAPVVIAISEHLWRNRYGSDPGIIGRIVRANAQPALVSAVMPDDFSFPTKEAIWMPAQPSQDVHYDIILRRADDVGNVAIIAALRAWFAQAEHVAPEQYRGKHVGIGDMRNINWGGALRAPLYMMLASAVLLLLLACTNTANILLARVSGQSREIVVRMALGATRRRILTYVLTESLLFSVAAACSSILLTAGAMRWLIAWFRANDFGPAHWQRFDVDFRVLACAGCAVIVMALLAGFPAAIRAYRSSINQGLRDTADAAITRPPRILGVLVLVQVTLSCALLISVAMMIRDIIAIDSTDVGIREAHLLTSRVSIPTKTYPTQIEQRAFLSDVFDRLIAQPGVVDVSIGSAVPGTYWVTNVGVLAKDASGQRGTDLVVRSGGVDEHFFNTFGVALQEGRLFDNRDGPDRPRVAIVDRDFARQFSPDGSVISREYRINPKADDSFMVTVVGVVSDLKLSTRMQPKQPAMLFFDKQAALPATLSITVRTDPADTISPAQLDRVMRDVDRDVPLSFSRYEDTLMAQTKTIHLFAKAFYIVGIVAIVLVATGLYGVLMVGVSRRRREIGLKRALGASSARLLASIFGDVAMYIVPGIILGFLVGIPVARMADQSLVAYGGSGSPVVLLGSFMILLSAVAFGAAMPVIRALRVDPATALRAE